MVRLRKVPALIFVMLAIVAWSGRTGDAVVPYAFAPPVFGLATAPDGSQLVADAGAGIVELRKGIGSLVAELPGVTDVAPIGRGDMFATRGGGPGLTTGALFRVSRGSTRQIADLCGTRHAVCPSPQCTVVAGGFTSIVDLTFGPDDTLYVVELDEASWAAVELAPSGSVGGTVNACNISTWVCTPVATGLPQPIAATVDRSGTVSVAIRALTTPQVITLP